MSSKTVEDRTEDVAPAGNVDDGKHDNDSESDVENDVDPKHARTSPAKTPLERFRIYRKLDDTAVVDNDEFFAWMQETFRNETEHLRAEIELLHAAASIREEASRASKNRSPQDAKPRHSKWFNMLDAEHYLAKKTNWKKLEGSSGQLVHKWEQFLESLRSLEGLWGHEDTGRGSNVKWICALERDSQDCQSFYNVTESDDKVLWHLLVALCVPKSTAHTLVYRFQDGTN
jgi:hypothetical protein